MHPDIVLDNAAKLKVINAWKAAGVLNNSVILSKIRAYANKFSFDFTLKNEEDFLRENSDWINEICKNNIQP